MKSLRAALQLAATLVMVACAGTNFERPALEHFVLGSTTKSQVVMQLGEPNAKDSGVTSGGQTLERISYIYASTHAESATTGVAARRASFLFHDQVLVGRDFASSFKSDSSYFDPKKATSLKQGMTRSHVLALMGKPGGEYGYPIIANRTGKALVYWFIDSKGSKYRNHILTVELDANDVVQSYKFYEQIGKAGGTPPPRVWSDDAERREREAQALLVRLGQLRRGMSTKDVQQVLGPLGLISMNMSDAAIGAVLEVRFRSFYVKFERNALAAVVLVEWGPIVPEIVEW